MRYKTHKEIIIKQMQEQYFYKIRDLPTHKQLELKRQYKASTNKKRLKLLIKTN